MNSGKVHMTKASAASCKNKRVITVKTENNSLIAVDVLKSQIEGNNVLGIHCEWNRNCRGKKPLSAAVLQIASYHGVVVLFHLVHFKNIPVELKELLENDQIVKIDSGNARHRMMDYNIKVANAFDICVIPTLFGGKPGTLIEMCQEYLKIKLIDVRIRKWHALRLKKELINLAATNVRACIDLFKFFVQNVHLDAERLDAEKIQLIIGQLDPEFTYAPVDDRKDIEGTKHKSKSKSKSKYVHLDNKKLAKVLEELRLNSLDSKHCSEYNVIGFDCDVDILSIKDDRRMAMLNLALYDGTSVSVSLSDGVTNATSTQLKEILENDRIVKVGISPHHDAKILERYRIKSSSMFDIRYMAESCGQQPDTIEKMLRKQIENQCVITPSDFPINHAQAAVTLFQAFAKQLHPQLNQQPLNGREIDVGNIIKNSVL